VRITGIEMGELIVPLRRAFTTSRRSAGEIREIVVRLTTDEGLVGYGSAPELPPAVIGVDEQAPVLRADITNAARLLLRQDDLFPAEWHRLLQVTDGVGGARCALDVALWDVTAQARGLPLYRLFGGARESVETDLTISLDTPDRMGEAARDAVAQGAGVLKVKLGEGGIDADAARLRAVADAAPGVRLRVDGNQGWTLTQARDFLARLPRLGVTVDLLEQPLKAANLAGLATLAAETSVPIIADESVQGLADVHRLVDQRAADGVNIKLVKTAGISQALEVARVAESAGLPVMVGSMLESPAGAAAALALACGLPGVRWVDLDTPLLATENPVQGGLQLTGMRLSPAPAPGLGITAIQGLAWLPID
jgi:L-alanine-DL-glutamate epimerase-like enolase superfamily enzyme